MARPRFTPEQEVRFAVVMYGGVSLAIYINGVVQELFRMVRATAPVKPLPEDPEQQVVYFDSDALKGTERVYRRLGQLLPAVGQALAAELPDPDAPVRTRFVVDILSGSSAGGINAILLAKAIANQQNLAPARDLWIHGAGIDDLLNDGHGPGGQLEGAPPQKPPRSLLNSDRLYIEARNVLREMADPTQVPQDDFSPSYAEELDLAVTTTDLQGLRLPIQLSDRVVYELRHRNVLRFSYAAESSTGADRNDFVEDNDELLAFAARCTSAFPFAFEPAVPRSMPPRPGGTLALDGWNPFFPSYVSSGAKWTDYAFADGGYLDNKPFSYATEQLRRRRADVPVRRKLLYLEPDPTGEPMAPDAPPLGPEEPKPPPDAVDNVLASVNLPRSETIRDDIQSIVERNRTVARIRRMTLDLRGTVVDDDDPRKDPLEGLHDLPPRADDEAVKASLSCPQLMYEPYLTLRVEMVIDDLATAFVRLSGGQQDSDQVEALRILIRRVVDEEARGRRRAFLAELDVRFRLRRLAFAQDRINELLQAARKGRKELRLSTEERDLQRLKRELNGALVGLRGVTRAARSRGHARTEHNREVPPDELQEIALSITPTKKEIDELLSLPDASQADETPTFDAGMRELLTLTARRLEPALRRADDVLTDRRPPADRPDAPLPPVPEDIRKYYVRFESFDMVMLPLTYPGLEEVNPVDVLRIAPEDATSLISEGDGPRRKLAGTSLGHFGGFLDETWRRNDLLWGRLDGAERILEALLPSGPQRDELLRSAQLAIIREELVDCDAGPLTDLLAGVISTDDAASAGLLATLHDQTQPADGREALKAALRMVDDDALLQHFRANYDVPRRLEPQATVGVAGRSADITGKLLEQASKARSLPSQPSFWLSRMGWTLWGVAEVAVPRGQKVGIKWLIFKHWTAIAMLLGAALILFGVLGFEAAQRAGWILLLGAVAARVVVWLAGAAMTEPPMAALTESAADARVTAAREELSAAKAQAAAVGKPVPSGAAGLARRFWPAGIVLLGIGLVVAGIWSHAIQEIGWVVVAVGLAIALLRWARAVPYQRRLRAAAAVALLLAVAFAGLELAFHAGEDVSSVVARLPGDKAEGAEHVVRRAWDGVWPWDDGADGKAGTQTAPVPQPLPPVADAGDIVAPPGLTKGDLKGIQDEIARLERRGGRDGVAAGILTGLAIGAPGAVAALSTYLQTTGAVPVGVAGAILAAIAHGSFKATLSPTVKLDVKPSLGGVKLGGRDGDVVVNPRFSLGGVKVGPREGDLALGPVDVDLRVPGSPAARRDVERFFVSEPFRFRSSHFRVAAQERLRVLRRRLAGEAPSIRSVVVAGYADYVGAGRVNRELSRERAVRIQAALGLPGRLVTLVPHGERRALAHTRGDARRRYDRRADVEVTVVRDR